MTVQIHWGDGRPWLRIAQIAYFLRRCHSLFSVFSPFSVESRAIISRRAISALRGNRFLCSFAPRALRSFVVPFRAHERKKLINLFFESRCRFYFEQRALVCLPHSLTERANAIAADDLAVQVIKFYLIFIADCEIGDSIVTVCGVWKLSHKPSRKARRRLKLNWNGNKKPWNAARGSDRPVANQLRVGWHRSAQ